MIWFVFVSCKNIVNTFFLFCSVWPCMNLSERVSLLNESNRIVFIFYSHNSLSILQYTMSVSIEMSMALGCFGSLSIHCYYFQSQVNDSNTNKNVLIHLLDWIDRVNDSFGLLIKWKIFGVCVCVRVRGKKKNRLNSIETKSLLINTFLCAHTPRIIQRRKLVTNGVSTFIISFLLTVFKRTVKSRFFQIFLFLFFQYLWSVYLCRDFYLDVTCHSCLLFRNW